MTSPLPETLMRTIDLNYPSNRYAVGGLLGTVLISRVTGRSWSAAGRNGLLAFLAWAVARELDPDHAESGSVALPVAGLLAWLDGDRGALEAALDVAGAGAVLAGLRFTTGSVGAVPDRSDDLALLGAAALSALSGQRAAALFPALAPAVTRLSRGEDASTELLRGIVALLPALRPARPGGLAGRLTALGALLTAPALTAPEDIDAQTDQGGRRVDAGRVRHARLLTTGGAALAALGGRGAAAGVLAAAHLAIGLRRSKP